MNESVTGYIDHVIFRNEENGYTVMILKGVDSEEELTCVGIFSGAYDGSFGRTYRKLYPAPGLWKAVPGVCPYRKMPEDAMAMERYLGSGVSKELVQHWQPGLSERFGKRHLHIVEEEPERLAEVKESVKKRRERSRCRLLRRQICAKQ